MSTSIHNSSEQPDVILKRIETALGILNRKFLDNIYVSLPFIMFH